eukprot:TRINITY_DN2006_c0_g1_i1.p3 TRINITY_DN2006_c0_g1~~TRINITY_DN2006_c0_g1_i1.p3  ORF type:complete len:118 (-),score=3.48 TRINITY_DN2006_c0_g1_i1:1175-1528(-)
MRQLDLSPTNAVSWVGTGSIDVNDVTTVYVFQFVSRCFSRFPLLFSCWVMYPARCCWPVLDCGCVFCFRFQTSRLCMFRKATVSGLPIGTYRFNETDQYGEMRLVTFGNFTDAVQQM